MKFVVPQRSSSFAALITGAACAAAGLWLARHYPVEPVAMTALWTAVAVASFFGWQVLPLLVPALVPVIGLAPWTGWLTFEELDLLVLAVAAGGYAALALTVSARRPVPWRYRALRWRAAVRVLMAVFGLSVAIAVWRGFEQAGGLQFGFWQGLQEPMNSLRAGKSFALVLLLLPLWQKASDLRPSSVQRLARAAWVAVLALTALGALWERWVYTGLLDFSTDYRTTSLYWEMNVGGASLDGALALSLPFALLWALRERRPLRFVLALGLLMLAFYACLTTFSRGVYLAIPLGMGLCVLLWAAQRRLGLDRPPPPAGPPAYVYPGHDGGMPMGWSLGVVAGTALAAWMLFGPGGYRALLALAGSVAVLLAMPASRAAWPRGQTRTLLLLAPLPALLLVLAGGLLIELVPKAAYLIDGTLVLLGLGLGWLWRGGLTQPGQAFALAVCWMGTLAGTGLVAMHWGGGRDAGTIAAVLALLAVAWIATQWSPRVGSDLRTAGWRVRGLVWTGCLLVCAVVAALGGGAYIGQRMSTGQQDFEGRLEHWRTGLGLLKTMDEWLLGKGSGRFPASFANGGPFDQRVGDYRLNPPRTEPVAGLPASEPSPGPTVTLTSGLHDMGNGEMFRLSQRLPAVAGQVAATVVLRSQFRTRLRVEVCEKFLLYPLRCIDREADIQPQGGAWQTVQLPLGHAPADFGGPAWAPRRLIASVTQNWRGGVLEIASVSMADSVHGPLLRNGDFSEGLARWFFSSDRYHMPFHMKSLPAHVLFEQGLLGLTLWTSLLVTALWRCTLGAARRHPLAPAVAGGLLAFLIVGLFDSLIDAPRIAFLFYALLALGLGLRTPSRKPMRDGEPDSGLGIETELPELDAELEDALEVRRAIAAAGLRLHGPGSS